MFFPGYGYTQHFTFLAATGEEGVAVAQTKSPDHRSAAGPHQNRRNDKRYLTEHEVSEITARSLSALRKDRHFGRGIPYSKLGRQVRYAQADVDRYMASCRIETRAI